jgi:hypothetical protein
MISTGRRQRPNLTGGAVHWICVCYGPFDQYGSSVLQIISLLTMAPSLSIRPSQGLGVGVETHTIPFRLQHTKDIIHFGPGTEKSHLKWPFLCSPVRIVQSILIETWLEIKSFLPLSFTGNGFFDLNQPHKICTGFNISFKVESYQARNSLLWKLNIKFSVQMYFSIQMLNTHKI